MNFNRNNKPQGKNLKQFGMKSNEIKVDQTVQKTKNKTKINNNNNNITQILLLFIYIAHNYYFYFQYKCSG